MRTIRVEVYNINELSESAQAKAHHNWLSYADYPWHEDNRKALEEFEKIFPVKITGWEYGGQYPHVEFEMIDRYPYDNAWEEMAGHRLATFIYNNYYDQIVKGKYFSLWSKTEKGEHNPNMGKLKSRRSKVMFDNCCPLTGYCVDDDLLEPIFEFLKKPDDGTTMRELMNDCLQDWAKACDSDYNRCSTLEYFIDAAEANGYEFYEDGRRV